MLAEYEAFKNEISGYDWNGLLKVALDEFMDIYERKQKEAANNRINTDAHIRYAELQEKYEKVLAENAEMKKVIERIADKDAVKAKEIFGRKSESMDSLIGTAESPAEDPLDESAPEPEQNGKKDSSDSDKEKKGRTIPFRMPKEKKSWEEKGHGGKNRSWIDGLPCDVHYELNVDQLDKLYGRYGWHIAFWTEYDTVEEVPFIYYHKKVCVPVISVGLGFELNRGPHVRKLLPGSYASPSLVAGFMYRRQSLSLPYYRQAVEANRKGLPITRQTIIGWANRFALDLFIFVYNHLIKYLIASTYTQCDETTAEVINDGRKAGSKSFMWIHVTGELCECNPVVIFSFELTRGTDHLRHFYQDFAGFITCDGYISYDVFGKEHPDTVTISGCMMHCRRYFAIAFFVQNISGLTDEEVQNLPEMKILMIFSEIYAAENSLKSLTAGERLKERQKNVKPLVDKLFDSVKALDQDENVYSDRMNRAISYALNREKYLRRFLEDGNIPIDDGFTERTLRGYCCGRKSSMFYDTTDGAEASAIIYSLVETAKLNKADPQLYLQYLLEKLPGHTDQPDAEFLDKMLPWSEEYRSYETAKKKEVLGWLAPLFTEPEKPRTPRKKDQGKVKEAPPGHPPEIKELSQAV